MPFRATPDSGRARRVRFNCFVSALPVGTHHPRDSRAAVDVGGERALVSGASALFRNDGDRWRPIQTPTRAAPARALVSGFVRGRVYLVGRTGLFRSDDWGRSWLGVGDELQAEHVSML